ncbi:hypothetical protein TTHERM_000225986 (macronuclear) [Tetrahymena thermophila SB210]|uniref:Uncharacterized protein n=1 Tax=Tetrahymena thermophila (strain SB210) TaxID=312017 RepID=W7XBL1_TETTS|nr:hypothetical protein TTHERM_000225986 [Tetrahymena thermophila SB210]EWS74732.1 hypothetical protein TTHERM_000225986 [Tetrahymena thermophila SB210]|eukprot:XP_012652733.1 hypothetical protein TTHERM_000225986 [Tetrahymena thermophila SB210]
MKDFLSGTYQQIMQHNKIVNLNNQTQQNEIVHGEQVEEKLKFNYDEDNKKDIFIPSLSPKSCKKQFQQQLSNDTQNTCQYQVLEELKTEIQKPDDFLESLRINQDNIINNQTNLDKQQDYQIRLNLNKSDQNLKKYAQSGIRNIQQQQQFQLFMKDSNNKLVNGVSLTPNSINRKKKMSQSNQLETQERETKNIKKQNEQKAIMMILNKQQLAALQVIGIDIERQSKNQENSKRNYLSEEATENHFKEQYEILQSKELQLQILMIQKKK